ncbi:hypothetical protein BRD16_00740 [Halobacteriales archaeon SW_6_65_46]|nr:MAG: hypothetical protein BRD16_00740 [Halobacteriales archaeon SW_6_65_46]
MSLIKRISKYAPKPIVSIFRPIHRQLRSRLLNLADSLKLIDPSTIYDEDYYAKRREDPWRSDAHAVSKAIKNQFYPNSVIDFGCAIGAHLEVFHHNNIRIKGVEGNPSAFKHAVVPAEHLMEHDLREPYKSNYSYDIALCFEVAEHLPENYADVLVDTLSNASNTVIMTAASPGQGGTHHVNEQPREYWYQKFESRGFEYDSESVQSLRSRIEVDQAHWVEENLMLFRSEDD